MNSHINEKDSARAFHLTWLFEISSKHDNVLLYFIANKGIDVPKTGFCLSVYFSLFFYLFLFFPLSDFFPCQF